MTGVCDWRVCLACVTGVCDLRVCLACALVLLVLYLCYNGLEPRMRYKSGFITLYIRVREWEHGNALDARSLDKTIVHMYAFASAGAV